MGRCLHLSFVDRSYWRSDATTMSRQLLFMGFVSHLDKAGLCPVVCIVFDDIYMLALRSDSMLKIPKQDHSTPWRHHLPPNRLCDRARTRTRKLLRRSKIVSRQSLANVPASASSRSLPLHRKGITYPNSRENGRRRSETLSLLAATPP